MAVPTLISQLSQTAALNSPGGGEAPFPDNDDFLRALSAFVAILRDSGHQWVTSISGTDTITGSVAAGLAAYVAGQKFSFVTAGANTGTAPTVNFNALGAKSITRPDGSSVAVGEIKSGQVVHLVYTGSAMQLMSSTRAATADTATTATTATSATSATTATTATTAGGSYLGSQVFSTAGSFVFNKNASATSWVVRAVGATGGGGSSVNTGANQYSIGQSAAGGTYVEARYTTTLQGATITVGSKGVGGTANGGDGTAGGATTIVSATAVTLLSIPGGVGANHNGISSALANSNQDGAASPGAATVSSGTTLMNIPGQVGGSQWISSTGLAFRGASGGSSISEGIPGTAQGATSGASATAAGIGGSGAFTGASGSGLAGGDGYQALVIVDEYA